MTRSGSDLAQHHHFPTLTAAFFPIAVVTVPLVLLFRWASIGALVGVAIGRYAWFSRCHLELTETDALVTAGWSTKTVPWTTVTAVRRAPWRDGGIRFETTTGKVRSPVPASWWGGRATAEQLAAIERWWLDHRGAPQGPTI